MRDILLFDVNDTLTQDGQPIAKEMVDTLTNLKTYFHVLSESRTDVLVEQFFSPMYQHGYRGDFLAFPYNGNATYRCLYTDLMHVRKKEILDDGDKSTPVKKLAKQYTHRVVFMGDDDKVKSFIEDNPELDCEYHEVKDYKETIKLLEEKGYV